DRERHDQGIVADEQGSPAAGAVRGARNRSARPPRSAGHRQGGGEGAAAGVEDRARAGARRARSPAAEIDPAADAPLEPPDSRAHALARLASAIASPGALPPPPRLRRDLVEALRAKAGTRVARWHSPPASRSVGYDSSSRVSAAAYVRLQCTVRPDASTTVSSP